MTSPALDGSLILNSLITISHSFHNRLRIAQNRFWWLFVEWCTRGIKKRLQSILAGLWCFHTVYQIVITLFPVIDRGWSLAELDTETLLNCESLAELNAEMSLSGRAAGLLNHGISPLSTNGRKMAQNRFWWSSVKRYAQLGQEPSWRVLAGLCSLSRSVFCLTYTTIRKTGFWVAALCTNFILVYRVLFTILN